MLPLRLFAYHLILAEARTLTGPVTWLSRSPRDRAVVEQQNKDCAAKSEAGYPAFVFVGDETNTAVIRAHVTSNLLQAVEHIIKTSSTEAVSASSKD